MIAITKILVSRKAKPTLLLVHRQRPQRGRGDSASLIGMFVDQPHVVDYMHERRRARSTR